MHSAFLVNFLIGAHRLGVADNVVNGGDTTLETLIQRVNDAVFELKVIKFRGDFSQYQLCSFMKFPRRLARLRIVFDMPSGRVRSVTRYLPRRQRKTITNRDMGPK